VLRLILQRAAETIPTLIGVAALVFLILHLTPGDPALLAAGLEASPETVEQIRRDLGLDQPLAVQFVRFLGRAVVGDLGVSIRTRAPVVQELVERFPHTLWIAFGGLIFAATVGVTAGVAAAVRRNRFADRLVTALSLVAVSTPSYWLALMLMLVFALQLGWLPALGAATTWHYVLPIITLGTHSAGIVARTTRSAMLETLSQEFVQAARAKGLGERAVVFRHALRAALVPIVSIVGLRFGGLLAGAVLTESVFAIPGVGRLTIDAVLARDYPMVQGAVLATAATFVLVNALVDALYIVCDPRVRAS
jgi:ABC-type dipeptide/oligopeptide/nickel transport system permease component